MKNVWSSGRLLVAGRWSLAAGCWLLAAGCWSAEPLVLNGSFEQPRSDAADQPLGWGKVDGLGVSWRDAPGGGKAIRMDTSVTEQAMVARWKAMGSTEWGIPDASAGPVGATYGLSLYSDAIAIAKDQAYAIELRHRGPGGGKIWVRGYARKGDALKRVYEAQAEVGTSADWTKVVYAFHPTRHTPAVTEVKVMLYAYWPAAESWFDDVVLRPASAEELATEDARRKR